MRRYELVGAWMGRGIAAPVFRGAVEIRITARYDPMDNTNHISAHPTSNSSVSVRVNNTLPFAVTVTRIKGTKKQHSVSVIPAYAGSVLHCESKESLIVRRIDATDPLDTIQVGTEYLEYEVGTSLLRSTAEGATRNIEFAPPVREFELVRVDASGQEKPVAVRSHGSSTSVSCSVPGGSILRGQSRTGKSTYFWMIVPDGSGAPVLAQTFSTGSGWNVKPRTGEAVLFFASAPVLAPTLQAKDVKEPFYIVVREGIDDIRAILEATGHPIRGAIESIESTGDLPSYPAKPETLAQRNLREKLTPAIPLEVRLLGARVGRSTRCSLYEQAEFAGDNFEPDDAGAVEGAKSMRSVKVQSMASSAQVGLRFMTSLSQDYVSKGDDAVEKTHFRSTVIVDDARIQWLEIGAWDAGTKILIDEVSHEVGPEQWVRVQPNELRRVVVSCEGDQAGASELLIRSNCMLSSTALSVFPDQEMHEKISNLPDNALHASKLANAKFSEKDCGQVQSALQSISKAVVHGHSESDDGIASHRVIDPTQMEHEHWILAVQDSGALRYDALSHAEVEAINSKAGEVLELDASVASSFFSKLGHSISHVVVKTTSKVGDAAKSAGNAVAHEVIKDTGIKVDKNVDVVGEGLKQLGSTASAIGNAAQDAAHTIGKGLELTLHFAEKNIPALRFVIHQAKHIAAAIESIVQTIEVGVSKFVEWLSFLFDWKDIRRTHDLLSKEMLSFLDKSQKSIHTLQAETHSFFDSLRGSIQTLRGHKSTGTEISHAKPSSPTHDSGVEKLEWFMNLFTHHSKSAKGKSIAETDQTPSFMTIVEDTIARLGADFSQFGKDIGPLADAISKWDTHEIVLSLRDLGADVLTLACDIVDGAVEAFFEVLADSIRAFEEMLKFKIRIPVISALYKKVAGDALTPLSVMSLILAIPVTVGVKLATHQVPFAGATSIGLSLNKNASIAYLTGISDIISGMSGAWTVLSAAGGTEGISKPSSPTSKLTLAKKIFNIILNGAKMFGYLAKSLTASQSAGTKMIAFAGSLRAFLQLQLQRLPDSTAKIEVGADAIYGAVKAAAGVVEVANKQGLSGAILIVGGAAQMLELGGYCKAPEVWGAASVATFLGSSAAGVLEFLRGAEY